MTLDRRLHLGVIFETDISADPLSVRRAALHESKTLYIADEDGKIAGFIAPIAVLEALYGGIEGGREILAQAVAESEAVIASPAALNALENADAGPEK